MNIHEYSMSIIIDFGSILKSNFDTVELYRIQLLSGSSYGQTFENVVYLRINNEKQLANESKRLKLIQKRNSTVLRTVLCSYIYKNTRSYRCRRTVLSKKFLQSRKVR